HRGRQPRKHRHHSQDPLQGRPMMRQLLAVAAACLAVFGAAFRLGWWASDQLSSYAQEIDPRIEKEYTR
ncbi:hypothetical protein, partial [Mycobacteroides abscessus]|uniref:hypothetical protein n=1 Tax=Mycobacteroides abscessus TaxID=36809 RepID=UPI001A9C3434